MSNNKEVLLAEFDRMENERQVLIKKLSGLPKESLERKPDAETWSVTEVIYHLKVAEEAALTYMRKKLEVGGYRSASFSAGLKQRLLNIIISLPIKFKAPKVAQLPKGTTVSFTEALNEWNAIREAMKEQYASIDEELVTKELFKHPITGKMNLIQSVRFMRKHMNRHIGQIEGLIQ